MAGTTVQTFERIVQLCDLLQHYQESAARLADAQRMDSDREQLLFARHRDVVVHTAQDSENDERDLNAARSMVERCEAACQQWMPHLNEFFHLATMNNIDLTSLAFNATRATRRMPHQLDAFDWRAFRSELLVVRDEATRRSRERWIAKLDGYRVDVEAVRVKPRTDEPTDADLLIGRQVLEEMATRNPAVEQFRKKVRATGLRGSNAKFRKVLDRLKAEKKMQK